VATQIIPPSSGGAGGAAAAGTLTGDTLAAGVIHSSLVDVGTLSGLAVTAAIAGSVTGNAATATALQNARTINGTSFDGTANITLGDQTVTGRMVHLGAQTNAVATAETTTSTSYADLATSGPALTITPGVTQDHLLHVHAYAAMTTAGTVSDVLASVAIAGAAALDANAMGNTGNNNQAGYGGNTVLAAAQSSGATHTMKYRVSGQTGNFIFRKLVGYPV
jgi:hypothetical protein